MSSVTPSVEGRPCTAMPTLSPTRTISQCRSASFAIGVEYAVRQTNGAPPFRAAISSGDTALSSPAALMASLVLRSSRRLSHNFVRLRRAENVPAVFR